MKFKQLCDSVANITNRPDFIEEIKAAVQHSTLKFHALEFWPRDRQLLTYSFSAVNSPSISLSQIERLRKIRKVYIQQGANAPIAFLNELQFNDLLDFGGRHKQGYFINNNQITINARGVTTVYLEAYTFPDVSPENYSSWIADLYPYLIVHNAAAMIYGDLGDIQQANRYQNLVGDFTNPTGLARPGTHLHTLLAEQLEA